MMHKMVASDVKMADGDGGLALRTALWPQCRSDAELEPNLNAAAIVIRKQKFFTCAGRTDIETYIG